MVSCPICEKEVPLALINRHMDSGCQSHIESAPSEPSSSADEPKKPVASIFQPASARKPPAKTTPAPKNPPTLAQSQSTLPKPSIPSSPTPSAKRSLPVSDAPPPSKKPRPTTGAAAIEAAQPLPERLRPRTLDDIHGQPLVARGGVLRGLIEKGETPSMILWGPAGCGKTTIARVISNTSKARFVEISATNSGIAECKKIFEEARGELRLTGRRTILFCDEIHRFSKSQQDVFLYPVERGEITLIGATTENPSFKVQNALLSRCRTFTLTVLTDEDIRVILDRALEKLDMTGKYPHLLTDELLGFMAKASNGDARTSLNLLSLVIPLLSHPSTTPATLRSSLTRTLLHNPESHYDTISAFHKSIRGSSPDGALYYLSLMLSSGEDPLYIARRMIVIASEDVGLADNTMLPLATATMQAVQMVGLPEARINLAHCAVALALAKKSTRSYRGLGEAMRWVKEEGDSGGIPLHLRNAPTGLMKELGYGEGYKYNPDYRDGKVKQEYLPEALRGKMFLPDLDLGTKRDPDLERDRYHG